ncbi:Os07g0477866, partial [Oryza sativa Japonica Group]
WDPPTFLLHSSSAPILPRQSSVCLSCWLGRRRPRPPPSAPSPPSTAAPRAVPGCRDRCPRPRPSARSPAAVTAAFRTVAGLDRSPLRSPWPRPRPSAAQVIVVASLRDRRPP